MWCRCCHRTASAQLHRPTHRTQHRTNTCHVRVPQSAWRAGACGGLAGYGKLAALPGDLHRLLALGLRKGTRACELMQAPSIQHLAALQLLRLACCGALKPLPEGIGLPAALHTLHLVTLRCPSASGY
jgi:hypothetical protein